MTSRPSPKLYTIAPGRPFLDVLAAGILDRYGTGPLALSRITVLLPTRRACRALAQAFLRARNGQALLLPQIRPLGDIDEDELDLRGIGEGDGVMPFAPLERMLLLAELVAASPLAGGDGATALRLARLLGDFLDTAATEEVGLDRLADLVPAELAGHWQQTLDFLGVIREHWPRIKAESRRLDAAEHRQRAMQRWIDHWLAEPPADPVIAAGSTGTIPATARLLKLVAALPQGAVVLPGLDLQLDDAAWAAVRQEPTHPQHALSHLLDILGALRGDVQPWSAGTKPDDTAGARTRLLSAALLPPGETHRWREAPDDVPALAFGGLQRIIAPGLHEEAAAIALAMRETLEQPGRTAALITPDRNLARRVAAELLRYGIEVDDSAGQPLAQTPPAVFLRLLAEATAQDFAPAALLPVLKHPFCMLGLPRAELLRWLRRLERRLLRKPAPLGDFDDLRRTLSPHEDLLAVFARLQAAVQPLREARSDDLAAMLQAQIAAAEALAAPPAGEAMQLWRLEAGEALHDLVVELLSAPAFRPVTRESWPRLLDALLEGRVVRPRFGRHPRVFIWGLLEARLQHADRVILGGLNEGTWPPQAQDDPWLSRPMRQALGLAPPERRLGQTAHDFVQAACGTDVILTRSEKVDGTPTVPARWLLRLDAYLKGNAAWQACSDTPYLAWAALLDRPDAEVAGELPQPKPPLQARPRKLPVTAIETWIRDPYALYARRILGLRKLDEVGQPPDARLRGEAIHKVLEIFLARHRDALPDDDTAYAELLALGRQQFGPWLQQPVIAALWWPRFERAMCWFLSYERERRAAGFKPALLEADGALTFTAPAGDFTLTAKADRIDRNATDGALAVLDYKTGNPPSPKQVNSGLAPQLALEAAIAQHGGFPELAAGAIAELVYIRLSGGAEPGEVRRIEGTSRTPIPPADELAQQALERLKSWVARFDDPAIPYLSRPRPQFVEYPGDYDHLARVAERAEGMGEET
ncbi:MAG TPA: double-strand break repair protein AddB [Ferrovibrio sp.]|uniref:double-strand break repair protein AddB n=1 Tax=Ferrovibrio sp. TaxID=1917215 RepID=UPI002ED5594A